MNKKIPQKQKNKHGVKVAFILEEIEKKYGIEDSQMAVAA